MFNQLYEKIKRYIKENYRLIIGLIIIYILFTYPLPYSIYTAGGIIDIDNKVSLDHEYSAKGSFNFSYVNELKGTIPTVLLSYVIPNWDLIKRGGQITTNETKEDVDYRNKLFLDDSIQNATIVAYQKLNKQVTILSKRFFIVYVDKIAITDLKNRDEILTINNKKINDLKEYMNIIDKSKYGDTLFIKVKTYDHKVINKKIKVINYQGSKITGIYIIPKIEYETIPKITYNFSNEESGPSGGLMLALTIYNKLTPKDITKGKIIVGTGTIDIDGNVGSISGIEYKLKGAVNEKADIFFVPNGDNYQEAIHLKSKNKYKINIIGISTFKDALNYLEIM